MKKFQKLKRIAAMIGVILLVGMYAATLILSLSSSPHSQNLLMASIVCTVVVPVLIYAMELVARVLGSSDKEILRSDEVSRTGEAPRTNDNTGKKEQPENKKASRKKSRS